MVGELDVMRGKLAEMWDARGGREKEYAEIVNVLQSLVERAGGLTGEQVGAIRGVMGGVGASGGIGEGEFRGYVRTLARAGCDVYRGLR